MKVNPDFVLFSSHRLNDKKWEIPIFKRMNSYLWRKKLTTS